MTYIRGTFRIVGASPDGDSVRFTPTKTSAFADAGINVRANSSGGVQLRLDAIDALETHYAPPGASYQWEQPVEFGGGAADQLLSLLGFSEVVRNDRKIVTSASPDQVDGYILSNFGDKYGRAVAMVYAGQRAGDAADGSQVWLDETELASALNYQLLAAGWVYPTFYSKLYYDLRGVLAGVTHDVRDKQLELWAKDETGSGVTISSREQLSSEDVIVPKLFRRLAEYFSLDETGGVDLTGFHSFLQAKADQLYTVPDGQMTHLDTLITVDGQTVSLSTPPEQIVFIED